METIIYSIRFVRMILLILILGTSVSGFEYPDTVWIPVTFYDFHADGSAPNFEEGGGCGHGEGMVENRLDNQLKLVFRENLHCNDRIEEWYRPSAADGSDTDAVYQYNPVNRRWEWSGLENYSGRTDEWVSRDFDPDYEMASVIIYDSLPFLLVDTETGTYEYDNYDFWLLDGKGFGHEGKRGYDNQYHNFSMTMELHHEFTYKGGEEFEFVGDDDVWVFIDGKMALDLGGVQFRETGSFSLDDFADSLDLDVGKSYRFDFFWAERQTVHSTVKITTNIIRPSKADEIVISIDSVPPDPENIPDQFNDTTLAAGESLKLYSYMIDDTGGLRPDWDENIVWEVIDSLGNPIEEDIFTGGNGTFNFSEAYGGVTIILTFQDPEYPENILRDTVVVSVVPGESHHLIIEESSGEESLRDDNPADNIVLSSNETEHKLYAVLRDEFGNYIGTAPDDIWQSLDPGVVTAQAIEEAGAGIVARAANSGAAEVTARSGMMSDTVEVTLENITYDSLRIVVNSNGITDIDTLNIRTDQDTTLYAVGMRSDNSEWDNISVNWNSVGIDFSPSAPSWDGSWNKLSPSAAGTGYIVISRDGGGGVYSDTLTVVSSEGSAKNIVLYPEQGIPDINGNNPYPPSYTILSYRAGDNIKFVAKIFDRNGVWLESYETVEAPISWSVIEIDGVPPTGELDTTLGYLNRFYPATAYNTVYITAEFSENGVNMADSVKIRVSAGEPHHIVIENSPVNNSRMRSDNPTGSVEFGSAEEERALYTVIRDRYGNYVSYADSAQWLSLDESIVTAVVGDEPWSGQGIINREADSGYTKVISQKDGMADTVEVILTKITYDSIRIVVHDNGLRDISSLNMRTDQDTTLYAVGKRSDNSLWDNIDVEWQSAGISLEYDAPVRDDKWIISPEDTGTGLITASYNGVYDTVEVVLTGGLPYTLSLYRQPGEPGENGADAYKAPQIADTVAAGDNTACVAKLFDKNGIWLEEYETEELSIDWHVIEFAGNRNMPTGILDAGGYIAYWRPEAAYNRVYVTASFSEDGRQMDDTVQFYIRPDEASHLVIEASSDPGSSPGVDNPVQTVSIGSRDTVAYVYAVLRDRFGNFVSHSKNTEWYSLDTFTVNVQKGMKALGEGRIIRNAQEGFCEIYAREASYTDTVSVSLNNVYYDSVRIVTSELDDVYELLMKAGKDTTLFVQGRRSDNSVWEFIWARWELSGGISAADLPPGSSERWTFEPTGSGNGFITVTTGSGLNMKTDSVAVSVEKGEPKTLAVYQDTGMPGFNNRPYPDQNTAVKAMAGERLTLAAKILDQNGVWLSEYEKEGVGIGWRVIDGSGNEAGELSSYEGYFTKYTPVKAFTSVFIEAKFSFGNVILSDTVRFDIIPGRVHHLVIESDQNREVSPNSDNPVDTLVLTSYEYYKSVYAVIRDSLGNWIGYSKITDWMSLDDSVVTADDGISGIGEGVVTRIDNGMTSVTAVNTSGENNKVNLTDTVTVLVKDVFYRRLRIVNSEGEEMENLTMSTNSDTSLYVQGLRSDSSLWENLKTGWASGGFDEDLPAPGLAHSWVVSPSVPGSGWIRVSLGIDSITQPDTVNVDFTIGEPVSAEISVITPQENLIAGDTITAVVKIKNRDGLVPGIYRYDDSEGDLAFYGDNLPAGSGRKEPCIIIGKDEKRLNTADSDETIRFEQSFKDGVDTVRFILYYAPQEQDSLHRLNAELGELSAYTKKFILKPGDLDMLQLEDVRKNEIDSLNISYPDGFAVIAAAGYDEYGNRRGLEKCNWGVSGTLHPIGRPLNTEQIYYDAAKIDDGEEGYISAATVEAEDESGLDSAYTVIEGPKATLLRAVTRDNNGNGYLDEIEIEFDSEVVFDSGLDLTRDIRGVYYTLEGLFSGDIVIDSIVPAAGDSSALFSLRLREDSSNGFQTDWKPYLTIEETESVNKVDETECSDGAGPVIVSVYKKTDSDGNISRDEVSIVFSEKIQKSNGVPVSLDDSPFKSLSVWLKNDTGFVAAEEMLKDINDFYYTGRDSVVFNMTNGNQITSEYYFSINAFSGIFHDLSDSLNRAGEVNRKVRPIVSGRIGKIVIGPNPLVPGGNHVESEMKSYALDDIHRKLRTEGGTVMSIDIVCHEKKINMVKGRMLVFDDIGNPVYSNESRSNLLPEEWRYDWVPGETRNMYFHWNGLTQKRLKAAPGVYRVVVLLIIDGKHRKYTGNVGVRR